MERFAGVLFKVETLDPDLAAGAVLQIDGDLALANDRLFVLADLIALGQIGIEIILAVKNAEQIDLGVQAKAGLDRLFNTIFVDHGQHPGHGGINQRDMFIGACPERRRRAGKQF